jgi:SAM-dependent methyltransferase
VRLLNPVRQFFGLRCAAYWADDRIKGLRFRLGDIATRSGTIHSTMNPDESVQYIEGVCEAYRRALGVSQFRGRIAEVGPGDSSGVGLMFKANGAEEVDLVDRFYSRRDGAVQAQVYRLLMERHESLAGLLRGRNLEDEESFPGVRRHYGRGASAEVFFLGRKTMYDVIVSCAVIEHVADPVAAFAGMAGALKPGGAMVHIIDLRDHGMFSYKWHELKFLEVPEFLYRRMVVNSGRPNRILLPAYRKMLAQLPLDADFHITSLAGVGKIDPPLQYHSVPAAPRRKAADFVHGVRHRFDRQFDSCTDEELSVTGFALVARKPLGSRPGA